MTSSTELLKPLEGKSTTLFLIAGCILVIFAADTAARVFADGGYSIVHSSIGPGGFFLGLVGLLGLYPALADRTPLLARVSGGVAAIPVIGWLIITVFGIGHAAGVLPGMSVVFPVPVFPILVGLTTILAYVLFGVASLRAGTHSRVVSIVLLVPAVPYFTLIVGMAVLGPVQGMEFAIDSGHALAHLAVGITLRSRDAPADRAGPVAETTP